MRERDRAGGAWAISCWSFSLTTGTPTYFYFDNDVWVDKAKAVFAANKRQNSEKLRSLLHEMFTSHHDVYSLLLAFLRRSGKNRQPKQSLPRIVLVEFQSWLEGEGPENEQGTKSVDVCGRDRLVIPSFTCI